MRLKKHAAALGFEIAAAGGHRASGPLFKAVSSARKKALKPQDGDWDHDVRTLDRAAHTEHIAHHEDEFRALYGEFQREVDPAKRQALIAQMRQVCSHWQAHRIAKHAPQPGDPGQPQQGVTLRKAVAAAGDGGPALVIPLQEPFRANCPYHSLLTAVPSRERPALVLLLKAVHEYSCVLANLDETAADVVRNWAWRHIPDDDLAQDGRDKKPHITCRYGLHGTDPAAVRRAIAGLGPVTARIGDVSLFQTPDYDVVKLDVESPGLHDLYRRLGTLEHTDTHPEYRPHLTLAYVKKGLGYQFTGPGPLTGTVLIFPSVQFSAKDGSRTDLPLGPSLTIPLQKSLTGEDHWRTERRDEAGRWMDTGGTEGAGNALGAPPAARQAPSGPGRGSFPGPVTFRRVNATTWEGTGPDGETWTIKRNSHSGTYRLLQGGQSVGSYGDRASAESAANLTAKPAAPVTPPSAPSPAGPSSPLPSPPLTWVRSNATTWDATDPQGHLWQIRRNARSGVYQLLLNGQAHTQQLPTRQLAEQEALSQLAQFAAPVAAIANPKVEAQRLKQAVQDADDAVSNLAHPSHRGHITKEDLQAATAERDAAQAAYSAHLLDHGLLKPLAAQTAAQWAFPASYPAQATTAAAQAWASQAFPHIEFDFDGYDVASANAVVGELVRLAQKYPAVAGETLRYVGGRKKAIPSQQLRAHKWKSDGAWGNYTFNTGVLGLNPSAFADPAKVVRGTISSVRNGWHPPGSVGLASILTHEFGHAMEDWLRHQNHSYVGPVRDTGRTAEVMAEHFGKKKDSKKTICGYAATSPAETWAEGFTMLELAPPGTPLPPLVRAQQRFLERVFRHGTYERENTVRQSQLPASHQAKGRMLHAAAASALGL